MGKYDDIIDLPRHISKKHPQMSIHNRSAQFAPFAALTGYGELVKETERETKEKLIISEDRKQEIDRALMQIRNMLGGQYKELKKSGEEDSVEDGDPYLHGGYDKMHEIGVEYFIPDERKQGGEYVRIRGRVKKLDTVTKLMIMEDGTEIPMDDIFEIII